MALRRGNKEAKFERVLADLFRRAGWNVVEQPRNPNLQPDLVVQDGAKKYVVEMKISAEGRKDRIFPLLSQAVLQAQAIAKHFVEPVVPIAIVAAAHIPDSVRQQVQQFALQYAPDVGVGVMDGEGFRAFVGHGLEAFNADRSMLASPMQSIQSRSQLNLFSDLNQWMLKVLLAADIPDSLLSSPRGRYQNASQLARAAGVSVMSAFRLVRHLSDERFLEQRDGRLQLVRIKELSDRWSAANQGRVREIPARWIIRGRKGQFLDSIRSFVSDMDSLKPQRGSHKIAPGVCVGLFAAAEALGFGFVHGVTPHLYLESVEREVLKELGLSVHDVEKNPDVYIRIPKNKETVFRAAIKRDGLPISDILQIWLDVSLHPMRGKEQADQIWGRVLAPCFGKSSI